MGLFDKFKHKSSELTLEDKADYVFSIYKDIDEKCNQKDNLDILNPCQRTLYVALMLEIDVHTGGFEEYFYSQSANYYKEAVESFEEIGSYKAGEICHKAISVLGDGLPIDRAEREDYFNEIMEDSIDEILYNCEVELKELSDELTSLCYDYIKSNEIYFNV